MTDYLTKMLPNFGMSRVLCALLEFCTMSMMGDVDPITATEEYKRFRSTIPQRKVTSTTRQHCMGVTFVVLWILEGSYHPFSAEQPLL